MSQHGPQRPGVPRGLFWLTVALGVAMPWLAPHPPMIDLPQHAGQLALLQQLLVGDGRWTGLFQVNPYTPYLIGLGLALPLTWLMPVAAAMQCLLSAAYLAFVAASVALRRHWGGDERLDWLCLCGFFGYAFHWGFFTFLTAAPLGLLFILLADRQAQAPRAARAWGLAALGLLLLVSHGLVFLFSWGVAAALIAWRSLRGRRSDQLQGRLAGLLKAGWPLLVALAACVAYFFARGPAEAAYQVARTVPAVQWQYGLRHEVLGFAFGLDHTALSLAASAVMLLAPWLLGLRPGPDRRAALVPLAVLLLVLNFVPSFVFETSFVYQRFALFLFPAYAWVFSAPRPDDVPHRMGLQWVTPWVLLAVVWAVMGHNAWRTWRFGEEEADFRRVSAAIEPGQRALALIHDPRSAAQGDGGVYVHHALWYQVEHQGLVDFNFAWVQPQIVRYRVAPRPPVALDFPWHPERFDWQTHQGGNYRYFFVRRGGQTPGALFKGAPCQPQLRTASGPWAVYERVADCRP